MKNKKADRKPPGEINTSALNFRTSVEVSGAILANLAKNCAGQGKEPQLDIFPETGLMPGAVTVVASLPCIGKSAYLVNVALGLAKIGKNVAVFLPDSTLGEFFYMAASISSGTFLNKIRRHRDSKTTLEEFRLAARALPKTGLYLAKRSPANMYEVEHEIAELVAALKAAGRRLDAVIIDSLNYFKDDEYEGGPLCRLAEAAKKMQLSCICSFALRQPALAETGHVRLADIRAAGLDERSADLVLHLHRPEYYDPADPSLTNKAVLRCLYSKDLLPLREYQLDFNHDTLRFTSPVWALPPPANEVEMF